jgi:hypothetical protein
MSGEEATAPPLKYFTRSEISVLKTLAAVGKFDYAKDRKLTGSALLPGREKNQL